MAMPAALPGRSTPPADLAKFALDSGGLDNITVVIIPFPPRPATTEPPTVATVPAAGIGPASHPRRHAAARRLARTRAGFIRPHPLPVHRPAGLPVSRCPLTRLYVIFNVR